VTLCWKAIIKMRIDDHFVILQSALIGGCSDYRIIETFTFYTLQDGFSWITSSACKAKANADIFQC
jgi:hypothetical protein